MKIESIIPFEEKDIEEMASSESYTLGEELYDFGRVGPVSRSGNNFSGYVNGRSRYKVKLNIKDSLEFSCSCPYDYDGICEHSVAFAFKILDRDYQVADKNEPVVTADNFDEVFAGTNNEKKLDFLTQLLRRDSNLRNLFIKFIGDESGDLDKITGESIEKIKEEVFNALSALDFSNFDGDDYYWDDDTPEDEVDDLIGSVLNPFFEKSVEYLKKENVIDSFRVLLGIYEGSQALPEWDLYDEFEFAESFNLQTSFILKDLFNVYVEDLSKTSLSDELAGNIFDLIFERASMYEDLIDEDEDEPDIDDDLDDPFEDDQYVSYSLIEFDGIFKVLIKNKNTAAEFMKKAEEKFLEGNLSVDTILYIATILEDEDLWIQTAEDNVTYDDEIARALLEKYRKDNRMEDFFRIAGFTLLRWPYELASYITEVIDEKDRNEIYFQALNFVIRNEGSLEHYKIYREHLSPEERISFIESCLDADYPEFYIQLLNIEERYEDILSYAKGHPNYYGLENLLEPVLKIYPDECHSMIIKKNEELINSDDRSRPLYNMMMKSLKLLKEIPVKRAESKKFLEKLYNHKPNLPALRDEMRKAGLVINGKIAIETGKTPKIMRIDNGRPDDRQDDLFS